VGKNTMSRLFTNLKAAGHNLQQAIGLLPFIFVISIVGGSKDYRAFALFPYTVFYFYMAFFEGLLNGKTMEEI